MYNYIFAVAIITFFSMIGAFIFYYIGAVAGKSFLIRYGKYLFIQTKQIEKTEKWFARYGIKAVFIGRFLPMFRTLVSFPAGMVKMDIKRFVLYTFFGFIIWNSILVYIGVIIKNHWKFIQQYLVKYSLQGSTLVIIYVIYILLRKIRNRHFR